MIAEYISYASKIQPMGQGFIVFHVLYTPLQLYLLVFVSVVVFIRRLSSRPLSSFIHHFMLVMKAARNWCMLA
jgi:hypothetical protein